MLVDSWLTLLNLQAFKPPLTFNTILTSGDRARGNETFAFGQAVDTEGLPIYEVGQRSILRFMNAFSNKVV